jgi:hypothetical protein
MAPTREKFAPQADPEILAYLRGAAAAQGRQLQAVIEDAMSEYLARLAGNRPRPQVMEALAESVAEFDSLYERLAQ